MGIERDAIGPRWLQCSVKNYDWGKKGRDSTVARLYEMNSDGEMVLDRSYAEMWMGTHESGPSYVIDDDHGGRMVDFMTLKDWIRENPNAVGKKVIDNWGCDLPFMFKVLSVAKALSIQAHPNKELASVLHKMQPGLYKDGNHKPEMALAITEFKALCGFITLQELKDILISVPEIAELVGIENTNVVLGISDKVKEAKMKGFLRSIFTKFMTANKETINGLICKMKRRLTSADKIGMLTEKELLALELEKQYPGDVGVISSFFFNYVKLNPGEALYLGPNEPHAYLSGECIECMATSDNVVRAGLTPKFRDVKTLCSMLTYKQGFPEILKGVPLNKFTSRYTPPFDEFEVDSCLLPCRESVVFPAVPGPSIFVALRGEGDVRFDSSKGKNAILEGDVLFVPEKTKIKITCSRSNGGLQLYRAGVNQRFFK